MDDITKAINDSINNENCSEVKRSLQLNVKLNREIMIANNPPSSKGKGKSARSKRSKKSGDRTPTSYITDYYAVNEWLYSYLKGLVQDFNSATQHFFSHVFSSCMLPENLKDGTYIPIPRKTLDKKFGKEFIDILGLIKAGLIEKTESYSIEYSICYCYRIHPDILDATEKYYPKSFEEVKSLNYVNLFDGRAIRTKKSKLTYGKNNLKLPELIYQAIKGIERTFVNIKAGWKHIKDCRAGIKTQKQYRKYLNDLRCLEYISRNIDYTNEGLAYYVPSYEPQKSGRISEKEGGTQSCSRALKHFLFLIPNRCNYDLKSSQVYILKWWFEQANISTQFLDKYLAADKTIWAISIGMSVKCLKNCMYAKFMGAELPNIKKYWDKKAGKYKPEFFCLSIVEYLLEEAQKINQGRAIIDDKEADEKLMLELLTKFNKFVKPLQQQLDKFYEWLVNDYCQKNHHRGIIKNLTGMPFNLNEYKNDKGEYKNIKELYRKLTAFFLQGTEAAFIHCLTNKTIQQKYDYEVISNQHDGLLTINPIPKEAIAEAKKTIGLSEASLEEKLICSQEEQSWWLT